MQDVMAIVMAAGKGTRMKSKNSKLVQKINGKEIVKSVEDDDELELVLELAKGNN